ncbi:MAG TPA: hypothetical protein PKE45_19055, partial [Caldilineaceae bacterium]|nr:hypothetical protein [Caldilineaceae bacterium]
MRGKPVNNEQPRGLLYPKLAASKFQLTRDLPAPELSFFVQRYWLITWDLRGQEPHRQENLSYPCVNLVFERGQSNVYGVVKGKSAQLLAGQGSVLGVKFRPGAFYPFFRAPVSQLTDKALPFAAIFGVDGAGLE